MRVSEPPSLAPEVLSARIRKIREAYSNCTLCSQRCGADRSRDPSGVCRLGEEAFVYREYLHFGEEPWISPSYTVYLSGCNLRCLFCSEWNPVTRPARHGVRLEPGGLAQRIAHSFDNGAKSLSFVGGEPGVNLLPVLETLALLPRDWPVVWNTNGMGILEPLASWKVLFTPGWWIGSSVTRNALERSRDSNPPPTKSSEPVLSSRERGRPCLSAIWSCRVTWSVAPFLLWNAGATSLARHRLT